MSLNLIHFVFNFNWLLDWCFIEIFLYSFTIVENIVRLPHLVRALLYFGLCAYSHRLWSFASIGQKCSILLGTRLKAKWACTLSSRSYCISDVLLVDIVEQQHTGSIIASVFWFGFVYWLCSWTIMLKVRLKEG